MFAAFVLQPGSVLTHEAAFTGRPSVESGSGRVSLILIARAKGCRAAKEALMARIRRRLMNWSLFRSGGSGSVAQDLGLLMMRR